MKSAIDDFDYDDFVKQMSDTIEHLRSMGEEVADGYADVLEEIFSLPEDDFMSYLVDAGNKEMDFAGMYLSGISRISPELTVIPGVLSYILGRLNNDGQPIKLIDYGNAYKLDTSPTDEIEDTFEKLAAKIEAKQVREASEPFAKIMNIKMPENRDEFMDGEEKFQKFLAGTIKMINNTYGYFSLLWEILPELGIVKQFFASCYLLGRTEGCDETLAEVQP